MIKSKRKYEEKGASEKLWSGRFFYIYFLFVFSFFYND